ncbi:sugar ABC transporter ATP-binding protein [Subtercola endophyticus]|uniref:sugar ABC transporter ATP-binding protein n=1 Tax=Subtercola endophyticus TaxID=2895559 RepID=UPI001E49541E|nr:sugar ABC transporter ATP-binding protein [Subtercola endophyticus]UFS58775.1 sugar ABC transporter ATP-binding protein [Subtercola endophyticus]
MSQLALDLHDLTKHFGGTRALEGAELTVRPGTVHALLGGNGSGKSTLIKILAGVYEADAGSLSIFGQTHALSAYRPATAHAAGLRFVHQDVGLFDELSVAENFALDAGYPTGRFGGVKWKALNEHVRGVLAEYELDLDPTTSIHALSAADRIMVAIARALQDASGDRLILVLDEPTASLPEHESTLLLNRIRRLADAGQTIIIVSHRLNEIRAVATDYTVLRDGTTAGTLVDAHPSDDTLITMMAGRSLTALRPQPAPQAATEQLVRLQGIWVGPLRGINLTVDVGEIVGIAGLSGSGRSTILRTLFGQIRADSGEIFYKGVPFRPARIEAAVRSGIALVPEDRGREAAFADLDVIDNLSVSVLRRYWRRRGMANGRARRDALALIQEFGVKVRGPEAMFSSMSGGNQQKVILARWMQRNPDLLLLDEPTQGVDVMSRADIYASIRQAAQTGCSVMIASSDVNELNALCDRVLVLRDGVVGDVLRAGRMDPEEISALIIKQPVTP